jgi:MraZ protein
MLTGEVEHQLDDRGRIAIPRMHRPELEHGAFVTRGWYGCLFLFPWEEWRKIEDRLSQVRLTNMKGDVVKQFLFGGDKCFLDRQGRILLPAALRSYAGLQRDCVIRGVGTRIEIWDKQRWAAHQQEQFTPERITEQAAELGI